MGSPCVGSNPTGVDLSLSALMAGMVDETEAHATNGAGKQQASAAAN